MIYVLKTYEAFALRPFFHVYVLTVLDKLLTAWGC